MLRAAPLVRDGVSPDAAKADARRSTTGIAALLVKLDDADAMLRGLSSRFDGHLECVQDIIGLQDGAPSLATLNALMLPKHTLFIADTFANEDPSAELLASIALMAADDVHRLEPVHDLAQKRQTAQNSA